MEMTLTDRLTGNESRRMKRPRASLGIGVVAISVVATSTPTYAEDVSSQFLTPKQLIERMEESKTDYLISLQQTGTENCCAEELWPPARPEVETPRVTVNANDEREVTLTMSS
jgi:hypothetical protein